MWSLPNAYCTYLREHLLTSGQSHKSELWYSFILWASCFVCIYIFPFFFCSFVPHLKFRSGYSYSWRFRAVTKFNSDVTSDSSSHDLNFDCSSNPTSTNTILYLFKQRWEHILNRAELEIRLVTKQDGHRSKMKEPNEQHLIRHIHSFSFILILILIRHISHHLNRQLIP
jgi:hypothetical protein